MNYQTPNRYYFVLYGNRLARGDFILLIPILIYIMAYPQFDIIKIFEKLLGCKLLITNEV